MRTGRLAAGLVLITGVLSAAEIVDHDRLIHDLVRRIELLSAKESPSLRTDTLQRAAGLLQRSHAEWASEVLKTAPLQSRSTCTNDAARELRQQLTEAEQHGAEALNPLAQRYLSAIEHGGEDPADYAYLAELRRRYGLSAGVDSPSVRVREALNELADLVNTDFNFALPTATGDIVSLRDHRGNTVLLTFMATWCGPCMAELPVLEASARENGIALLAITDESAETVREFLRRHPFSFPVLIDTQRTAFQHFHVEALPANVLIDANGRWRAETDRISAAELQQLLRKMAE